MMKRPLRVLLVEDDPNDAELLIRKLRSSGFVPESERVERLDDVSAALERGDWDLVLSDHSMPGFRSADVLALMKERKITTPLIIVSGAIGEQEVVEALYLGAASYVDKSSLSRLVPTIERVLSEAALRQEHQAALRNLELVRAAVESAHDLIFILQTQPQGDPSVIYVNGAVERMTGYSAEEAIEHGFARIHGHGAESGVVDLLFTAMSRNEPATAELLLHHRDGSTRWVETSIRPIAAGSNRFVSVSRDITDRKNVEAQMAHLAMHDPLTGLANRTLLEERLEMEFAKARRSGLLVAVLLIDFDNFKRVNDTYGHACGDELLRELGRRLRSCVREVDTVARLGGDEFVVVLTELASARGAEETAERLLADVRRPILADGRSHEISVSIGIAIYRGDAVDVKGLLKDADVALYRVKASGRNGFAYEPVILIPG
jgi:diguanylate cyclase (GGDEF)-like protein/PAS domain S-box-containing protein